MGPQPDGFDLGTLLGRIETRLDQSDEREKRIEGMLVRWEEQHEACRNAMDGRIRHCEEKQAYAYGIAAGISFVIALAISGLKGLIGR